MKVYIMWYWEDNPPCNWRIVDILRKTQGMKLNRYYACWEGYLFEFEGTPVDISWYEPINPQEYEDEGGGWHEGRAYCLWDLCSEVPEHRHMGYHIYGNGMKVYPMRLEVDEYDYAILLPEDCVVDGQFMEPQLIIKLAEPLNPSDLNYVTLKDLANGKDAIAVVRVNDEEVFSLCLIHPSKQPLEMEPGSALSHRDCYRFVGANT